MHRRSELPTGFTQVERLVVNNPTVLGCPQQVRPVTCWGPNVGLREPRRTRRPDGPTLSHREAGGVADGGILRQRCVGYTRGWLAIRQPETATAANGGVGPGFAADGVGSGVGLVSESLEPRKRKQVRVNGRNLPFDALAASCGIDTRNRAQVGRLTKALKDIRAYFAEEVGEAAAGVTDEDYEAALAKAILTRARLYSQRFPRVELTPTALAAWWHQLARPSGQGRVLTELDRAHAAQLPNPLDEFKRKHLGGES